MGIDAIAPYPRNSTLDDKIARLREKAAPSKSIIGRVIGEAGTIPFSVDLCEVVALQHKNESCQVMEMSSIYIQHVPGWYVLYVFEG